ncbi:DUF2956 domain-containing protein [Kistimonas scapharcae]|uniref:DUF2956 domain-containing protein n=1 Tax=Kistimonas scapharcae TaxID=1036133 RepID=A0ABP8V9B3_9GAMM
MSQETRDEAMKIARGTQRPGQTKEQTRVIAQGIQKGIDQYKKQQKAKARELDKQRKKALSRQPETVEVREITEVAIYRQHPFPWILLVVTWVGIAVYAGLL